MIQAQGDNDMTYEKTRHEGVFWRRGVLYFKYRDENRKEVTVRVGPDGDAKSAAAARQAAQQRAMDIRAGVLDPAVHELRRQAMRPLTEHFTDYRTYLTSNKQAGEKHVKWTMAYLNRLGKAISSAATIGVDQLRLRDITAPSVSTWLATFDGARSYNAALKVVRAFLTWAKDSSRVPENPISKTILPTMEDTDQRRASRALTPAELDSILHCEAIAAGRRLAYWIIARLGLRWTEFGRLQWEMLDLSAGAVVLPASVTKTKRGSTLPIPSDLLTVLRKECGDADVAGSIGKPTRTGPLDVPPRLRTWRHDLVSAGICKLVDEEAPINSRYDAANLTGYEDDQKRRIDRKCLRKTFGTHLAMKGVDLRKTQRLMRHSSPTLTSNIYTDPELLELRKAADSAAVPVKKA